MANGNDQQARLYLDAAQAQLGERVTNLGRRQTDLENEMRNGFRTIEQSIGTLSNSISERNKPNFQALGVMLTAMVVLGGLLYWPIREGQARIDTTLSRLQDTAVARSEWNDNLARGTENRQRLELAMTKIAENSIGRNELTQMVTEYRDYKTRIETELGSKLDRNTWEERNASRDHDIENIRQSQVREVENLQRQVDLQRSDFLTFSNSLGNGRDFIVDLKTEVARLRDQLAEIRARQYQQLRSGTLPPS